MQQTDDGYLEAALKPGWRHRLHERCLADFGSEVLWRELESAYGEPHRAYHDLAHLSVMFALYDRVEREFWLPKAVRIAIWFHDFVYSTNAEQYSENEARSAKAMLERLWEGATQVRLRAGRPHWERLAVQCAEQLILATKKHHADTPFFSASVVGRRDAHLFLDIDLAILACPPGRVAAFDDSVRAEFSQYSNADFAGERVKALSSLLGRERVFLSEPFAPFEDKARANLEMLISAWRGRGERATPRAG